MVSKMKKRILLPLSILMASVASAQDAVAESGTGTNYLEVFLGIVAVVLAFVIWGLGNVLIALAKNLVAKHKKSIAGKSASIITVLLLLSIPGLAQDAAAPAAEPVVAVANYGGLSPTTFYMLTGVIVVEFLIIFLLVYNIRRLYAELIETPVVQKSVGQTEEKESWIWRTWHELDRKFFTKAAEKETDVLLDHDYDGIRELDNALPPWWKYGFYVTIVVAVIYLLRFHMWGTGPSPEQEYAAEMEKAQIQIQEYMAKAKDLVDENNVSLTDASGISAGNALYQKTCVACHGQKGEGGVGPNLTDDFWIHGGSMNDIFKTIKYGYPDKGMQSWQAQFSPKQIQQISSFVKSLKGTNPPNPKAPQGDLYQEGGKEQPATDSIGAPKKEEKVVAVNG